MRKYFATITFLVAMLATSVASATALKIELECQKQLVNTSSASATCIAEGEASRWWIDIVVGVDVVGIQLTGDRKVVQAGFGPSFGFKLAFKPWFDFPTPEAVAIELTISGSLLNIAGGTGGEDRFIMMTTIGPTFLGFLHFGIGGMFALGATSADADSADLIFTSGIRAPI